MWFQLITKKGVKKIKEEAAAEQIKKSNSLISNLLYEISVLKNLVRTDKILSKRFKELNVHL